MLRQKAFGRAAIVFIGLGLTVFAQAERKLSVEGVALVLPKGWEWQAEGAPNIAVKAKVTVRDREDEVLAELFFSEERFINDRLQELEADAKESKGDIKDFKVEENQSFLGQSPVTVVSYVRERGSDPVRVYARRHALFRRFGHLYEWREEQPKDVPTVTALLGALRSALKFSRPANPVAEESQRDYVNQSAKYKLPPDWGWASGVKGTKVEVSAEGTSKVLFVAISDMIFKEGRGRIGVALGVMKTTNTVDQLVSVNKETFTKDYKDVQEFETLEKVPFRGEKATVMTFTGIEKDAKTATRFRRRIFIFKHKGHAFFWQEFAPSGREAQAMKLFEIARKGLSTY